MLFAIITSTPQFYVLTMIDKGTPQFIASALASAASEWVGAVVAARAAHHKLAEAAQRTPASGSSLSRVVPARLEPRVQSGAQPSQRAHSSSLLNSLPDPAITSALANRAKDGPASPSRTVNLASHECSPASQREAAARHKLLVATRVAHADLGEKVALILGCTAAIWISGRSRESTARASALILLEAVTDLAKAATYAASGINVGNTRFNFHFPTLTGVAFIGGVGCAGLLLSVRLECWVGESVVGALG